MKSNASTFVNHQKCSVKMAKLGSPNFVTDRVGQPVTVITEFCMDGVDELIKRKD